jgi:autoinducer 2-degrading protein
MKDHASTDGFVILARFRLRDGTRPRFLAAVRDNAAQSVATEPGCRRFDVLTPLEAAGEVVLYEIYDDEAAFAAHLATPHYAAFREVTAGLVLESRIERLSLDEHAR